MGPVDLQSIPFGALLLVDSAPIIYLLEENRRYASRFWPVFDAHARGSIRIAISTITVTEILVGPLQAGEEALLRRYRSMLESWQVVPLDINVAESAARLRASLRLRLADAVQVASALAVNAAALVTHDRDFSRVRALPIIS